MPAKIFATVQFTLKLRCGELPVLETAPKTTGDWSLSSDGWGRTYGKGLGERGRGLPFEVIRQ